MTAPRIEQNLFDRLANEPSAWFGSADTLLKAAAHVWCHCNEIPHSVWVALMLRGYAVENLLKGRWVQEHEDLFADGAIKWQGPFRRHDLAGMAADVNVSCSAQQTNVLVVLGNSVLFLGRYPLPLRSSEMPVQRPQEPDERAIWCPSYESEFWTLVKEIASGLKRLPDSFLDDVMTTTWQAAWERSAQ